MVKINPKVYIYRMICDRGIAPNYNGEKASLALCKPRIRQSASVGDYVIGLSASTILETNKNVYYKNNPKYAIIWMGQVSDKLTFSQYNHLCQNNKKMKVKMPTKSGVGDCQIISETSFRPYPHERSYMSRNLSGRNVLLFKRFKHFRKSENNFTEFLPRDIFDASNLAIGHRVVKEPKSELIEFIEKRIS
jgi:hypothetical protein